MKPEMCHGEDRGNRARLGLPRRWVRLSAIALLAGSCAFLYSCDYWSRPEGGSTPDRPNILLIIGDDHGWPYYGFMDSPQTFKTNAGSVRAADIAPTPNLDELAARGVVFTRGYATASVCRPSLQTLLSASGLHPLQWQERQREHRESQPPRRMLTRRWSRFFRTLPRELQRYGYRSWEGGKMWEGTYLDAGFTHGLARQMQHGSDGQRFGRDGWDTATCGSTGDADAPCPALDPLRVFLDAVGSDPFFAWVAPMLPHAPYDAPATYREPFQQLGLKPPEVNHLSNIRWFDEFLGEILGEVDRRGLRDNTLIVYVSDNGWGINFQGFATYGRGKGTPYDLGTRTPIIFAGMPGMVRATHDDLIQTSDIVATILGYVRGALIPSDSVGINLRARIEGGAPMGRETIITHADGGAVLEMPWRYLRHEDGREELHRLDLDPFEENDLASAHPERARAMGLRLDEHRTALLQPPRAEIVGQLVDQAGRPIAGAELLYGEGATAQVVSTDRSGWFVLSAAMATTPVLRAHARVASLYWPGAPNVDEIHTELGALLQVAGQQIGEPIEVPLGGRIVGRLVDADSGDAVAGAHVRATARQPRVSLRTFSDVDGSFRLEGLPVNDYQLTIKSLGHRYHRRDRVAVESADAVVEVAVGLDRR